MGWYYALCGSERSFAAGLAHILANASTPVVGLLTHLCRGVRSSERRAVSVAKHEGAANSIADSRPG